MKLFKVLFCLLVLSSCNGDADTSPPVSMLQAIQSEIVLQSAPPVDPPAAPMLDIVSDPPEPPQAQAAAVEKGALPRLIVFTAPEWCVPCQKLDRNILTLAQMVYQDEIGRQHYWGEKIGCTEDYAIQIVDASDPDGAGAKTAERYVISKFPTIVRIDKDGKRESQYSGVLDAETICRYQAGKWAPPQELSQIVQGETP